MTNLNKEILTNKKYVTNMFHMNVYFFIAEKISQKSHRKGRLGKTSNLIAVTSVAISIAVMIIAICVADGFRTGIREKASGFSGDITLAPPGQDIVNHLYPVKREGYTDSVARLKEVKNISPVAYRSALLKTTDQIEGIMMKGVDGTYDLSFFEHSLTEGALPRYRDSTSSDILMSRTLASRLGYKTGDTVTAFFIGEELSARLFKISGLYNAQLEGLDKKFIIADLRIIQDVNGWSAEQISGYEVSLKRSNRNRLAKCCREIDELIGRHTPQEEDITMIPTTVEERFYILFDWLRLLDINVLILLVLMTAVAGFNMISGLLIFIFEKMSHIGVLKALGMSNSGVAKIFLYRSAVLMLKGMAIGNAVALLFAGIQWKYELIKLDSANYSISYVPINIEPVTLILVNLLSFAIIMALLLLPCHMIGKVSPAKTITAK